ncbi:hypothetical protein ACFL6I_07650 [candidate division KSB1 bacterium]
MNARFNNFNKIISQQEIEKLVKQNNIIEVAREIGLKVTRSVIPCIEREQHVNQNGAATLSFNLIANTYKCWVCPNVGGDVIDLIMQVKNVDRQKAIEFLMIRSEIKSDKERNDFFNGKRTHPIDEDTREVIYQDFIAGLDHSRGIELISFASTKGGTGKSLVVNNTAVILSLISRYIGIHRDTEPQIVELIDLDFGKPDQRLLLGIEPELYIEDIFYQPSQDRWSDLRQTTPIENLHLVSACPVRKSNSLYYLKKHEILYMLHNSNSLLKLADFGGGTDKDTLDFLSHIKSKIFVINPDKASIEAVFNLILSLIYYPLKQRLKGSKEALALLEEFRNCSRSGLTINKLREGFSALDMKRSESDDFLQFYDKVFVPFKKEMRLNETTYDKPTIDLVKADLLELKKAVYEVMFYKDHSNGASYIKKSKIYGAYNSIESTVNRYTGFHDTLNELLKTRLFGLIINKATTVEADPIAEAFVDRVARYFSMRMTYLGNIPEENVLRNISNYQMPFFIYDPRHPVLDYFYHITDKIIGLKSGSSVKIISDQLDYVTSLKMNWLKGVKTIEAPV